MLTRDKRATLQTGYLAPFKQTSQDGSCTPEESNHKVRDAVPHTLAKTKPHVDGCRIVWGSQDLCGSLCLPTVTDKTVLAAAATGSVWPTSGVRTVDTQTAHPSILLYVGV